MRLLRLFILAFGMLGGLAGLNATAQAAPLPVSPITGQSAEAPLVAKAYYYAIAATTGARGSTTVRSTGVRATTIAVTTGARGPIIAAITGVRGHTGIAAITGTGATSGTAASIEPPSEGCPSGHPFLMSAHAKPRPPA